MTDTAASPEQEAIGPARVPAVLSGPHQPSDLYRRLRTEQKIAFLPTAVTAACGVGDCFLHERMMVALHTDWTAVPVALGVGTVGTGLAAGAMLLTLSRVNAADVLDLKRIFVGALGSGGVLTLVGNQPILLAAYLGLTAIATGKWHMARWTARRALKRALMAKDQKPPGRKVLPAAKSATQQTVEDWTEMLAEYMRRWQVGVASKSEFTGSKLLRGQVHDEGRVSFVLQSGEQGIRLDAAQNARDQIASALRLKLPDQDGRGGQNVVFDQPPGEVDDRGQLRVQIINLASKAATSGRVSDEVVSADDNPYSVRIGSYVDDGSPAFWDFADHDGAWSGVVLAGTGMGKSSFEDALAYKARRRGFRLGFLDPQQGASSPVLTEHAEYVAMGPDGAVEMLRWLEDAADVRESWMGMHGLGKITPWTKAPCLPDGERPEPNCPCGGVVPPPIMTFIDECDQVFNAVLPGTNVKLGDPYGKLAKRIRKMCMGIVAFTQLPELKTFGGSDLLRSNLPVRNLLAMHVSSNVGGTLIPGLPYSPKLLPRISGRGLMCGQSSRVMEVALDWLPRREDSHRVAGQFGEDLFEAATKPVVYGPDQDAAERYLPVRGADRAGASRHAARDRFTRLLSGQIGQRGVEVPEAGSLGSSDMSWPEPVLARCAPPTAAESAAMSAAVVGVLAAGGVAGEILDAISGDPGDAWVTFGDLARRIGRVPVDADNAELRARARDLSAELAGWAIPMRRRADGMSATVAEVRAALAGERARAYAV